MYLFVLLMEVQSKQIRERDDFTLYFFAGRDAWVDVGNKLIGVQALQKYFKIAAEETLHVGDQFLSTGNGMLMLFVFVFIVPVDIATRSACCTLWVTQPTETRNALETIIEQMDNFDKY